MTRILAILPAADERTVLRMQGVRDFFLGAEDFVVDFRMADQAGPQEMNAADGVICLGACGPGVAMRGQVVGVGREFRPTEGNLCWIREDLQAVGSIAAEILADQAVSEGLLVSSGKAGEAAMWKGFSNAAAGRKLVVDRIELSGDVESDLGLIRQRIGRKRCGVLLASPLLGLPLFQVVGESTEACWITGSDAPGLAEAMGFTAVVEASRRMGWLAAACIAKALRGDTLPAVIEVPPLSVESRRSTYPFGNTGCEEIERALSYIRSSLDRDIGVDDVAVASGVSRSVLQRRVKEMLNLSVLNIIQWHRVERIKIHLRVRSLSMEQISELTGFSSSARMTEVFKKWTGRTPSEFRSDTKTGRPGAL